MTEFSVPKDEYVTTAPGVRLFIQTLGTGPQLVVIPNGYYLFEALEPFVGDRTLVFVDPRNRGRSDLVADRAQLERGIRHDVDDFDAIRRHFGRDRIDLIGHSYMGVTVALYAMTHPQHTGRVMQIGAMPANPAKALPSHLAHTDETSREVFAKITELNGRRASMDPMAFCKTFWSILRGLYVLHASDAERLGWEPCHLPNEAQFMKQFTEYVVRSVMALNLTDADYARAAAPVLAIHGRQDRSSPYGGGREWAMRLPNARLVTVDDAAHVPWIENPGKVFGALGTFLNGSWPADAERVESLD